MSPQQEASHRIPVVWRLPELPIALFSAAASLGWGRGLGGAGAWSSHTPAPSAKSLGTPNAGPFDLDPDRLLRNGILEIGMFFRGIDVGAQLASPGETLKERNNED